MSMNIKKLAPTILTALTFVFVACATGGNNGTVSDTQNVPMAPGTITESMTETEKNPYDTANYNGYNYRMLVRGPSYGFWESNEMWSAGTSGEVLNDAVYQRIVDVEDMYKVKITMIKSEGSVAENANVAIQSGEDAYDMLLGAPSDASTLSLSKSVYDLHSINSIKLDMPWWDQDANSGLSVANKLYYTTGEISYDRYRATEAMLFNKAVIVANNLEDPYKIVQDGKWTFDKVVEMCQGVSQDLDGNGVWDEKDKYGMVTYTNVVTSGIFASGIHYNTKDENDLPVLSFFNERTVAVVQDYINFTADKQLCFDWSKYYHLSSDPNTNVGLVIFKENRALFDYNGIHAVPNLRNMFSDFGIVPLPKFDEAQEGYYHCANNTACPFVMIPVSSKDPERSGMVLEALAHKGHDLVKVAFYDITLKSKASRDEESSKMLDLIFDNMVYDLAFFGNFGNIGNLANDLMAKNDINIASAYAANETTIKSVMDKFISDITK